MYIYVYTRTRYIRILIVSFMYVAIFAAIIMRAVYA